MPFAWFNPCSPCCVSLGPIVLATETVGSGRVIVFGGPWWDFTGGPNLELFENLYTLTGNPISFLGDANSPNLRPPFPQPTGIHAASGLAGLSGLWVMGAFFLNGVFSTMVPEDLFDPIADWVQDGGSLVVFGDPAGSVFSMINRNSLLASVGSSIGFDFHYVPDPSSDLIVNPTHPLIDGSLGNVITTVEHNGTRHLYEEGDWVARVHNS